MTRNTLRNTFIAGVGAVAMVAASSLVTTNEAHAGGKHWGAFAGGLVLGGLIASTYPAYGGPVYGAYPYCQWQKQKVYDPYVGYYVWRSVKVCY